MRGARRPRALLAGGEGSPSAENSVHGGESGREAAGWASLCHVNDASADAGAAKTGEKGATLNLSESPEGEAANPSPAENPHAALTRLLQQHAERLSAAAERWKSVVKPMAKWTKPGALDDFGRLEKEFQAWRDEFGSDLEGEFGLAELLAKLEEHLTSGRARARKELGRQIKEACQEAGLRLKVVSREDPVELRIPPFAVRLDLEAGKAHLLFAKEELESCPARADDILRTHQTTEKRMNSAFDPKEFFARCLAAYRMGLVVRGQKFGERLELNEFLGHLATRMQSPAFAVNPTAANYRGYSRGQFAYDVHRLRQARALQQDGKRLNFGVATGTAATQKKRVIYLEDDLGQGEYKLNVYFTDVA